MQEMALPSPADDCRLSPQRCLSLLARIDRHTAEEALAWKSSPWNVSHCGVCMPPVANVRTGIWDIGMPAGYARERARFTAPLSLTNLLDYVGTLSIVPEIAS